MLKWSESLGVSRLKLSPMFDLKEDTICYQNDSYESKHLVWVLLSNSLRTLKSVYLFKHFEEYKEQLLSDKNEDKKAIYWNASFDEKLIDYIKISLAFETFNKAVLIKKGILVHTIDKSFSKPLAKIQYSGKPILVSEFLQENSSSIDFTYNTAELNGFEKSLKTINYSHTLNENYQNIIQLDKQLVGYLKDICQKRNRLHFYNNFKGGFSVYDHLKKWDYIMKISIQIIKKEVIAQNEILEKHQTPFYSTF